MLLLAGFCVLVRIVCGELQLLLRNTQLLATVLTGAIVFILVPSVVFDIAYVRAMQQKDASQVLREKLQKAIGDAAAIVGVWHYGPSFFTVMPAAKPLSSQKIMVQLQESPGQNADFFLVGFPTEIGPAEIRATVQQVEAQGKFQYAKRYRVPVKIFGHEFSLARFPQDMTYPFPTILLFRARAPT